jgi:hypothetical protein
MKKPETKYCDSPFKNEVRTEQYSEAVQYEEASDKLHQYVRLCNSAKLYLYCCEKIRQRVSIAQLAN